MTLSPGVQSFLNVKNIAGYLLLRDYNFFILDFIYLNHLSSKPFKVHHIIKIWAWFLPMIIPGSSLPFWILRKRWIHCNNFQPSQDLQWQSSHVQQNVRTETSAKTQTHVCRCTLRAHIVPVCSVPSSRQGTGYMILELLTHTKVIKGWRVEMTSIFSEISLGRALPSLTFSF